MFEFLGLFRVGLVNEDQPGPSKPPEPLPAYDLNVVTGAAIIAFVLLIAMVIGLGRRPKPPKR